MRDPFKFDTDNYSMRRDRMLGNIVSKHPGAMPWWHKQPVNCFQMAIDDLDEAISQGDARSIEVAFRYAKTELDLWVRFYLRALEYVDQQRANGKEVHWRLLP